MNYKHIYILGMFFLTSCLQQDYDSQSNDRTDSSKVLIELCSDPDFISSINSCPERIDPKFDQPLLYLDKLRWRDQCNFNFVVVWNDSVPENWVSADDIPYLIKKMESRELAFPTISVYASVSFTHHGYSTIGNEAYHIIQFYRTGNYPPYSTVGLGHDESDTIYVSKDQKIEIAEWWAEESK